MTTDKPLRDTSRPIPDQHFGPPREAESIIESITNEALKRQAIGFFGCFRYQSAKKTPCGACLTHRLNVLHCLDSWEEFCHCSSCHRHDPENHICMDYPDDLDDGDFTLDD